MLFYISQVIAIILIVVVGQFAQQNVSIGLWFMTGVLASGALLTCKVTLGRPLCICFACCLLNAGLIPKPCLSQTM